MLSQRYVAAFAQSKYSLRALGFEILRTLLRRWTTSESPKLALRRSHWIAVSRCAIHILPCAVFLFHLPLNFKAMYLVPGSPCRRSNELYPVLFQIVAKLLEIPRVASLTTVVLHVLDMTLYGMEYHWAC